MKITRGKIPGAKKCVLYGPEGIGKSTLAAQFPSPLFIDTENGTKELDVARFDKPTSWEMLLQEVRYVLNSPDICKTLVVDTADWAEKLCIKAICDQHQKRGIESFDYGKGYTFVYEGFGELLNLLADVTERGIHVVLTAHAATKRREQPDNRAALAALWDLMKANGVEDFQVQAAFAARGYFPEETPLENLPADFINGVLVGAWKQVYGWIQANQPLPF